MLGKEFKRFVASSSLILRKNKPKYYGTKLEINSIRQKVHCRKMGLSIKDKIEMKLNVYLSICFGHKFKRRRKAAVNLNSSHNDASLNQSCIDFISDSRFHENNPYHVFNYAHVFKASVFFLPIFSLLLQQRSLIFCE